MPRSYAWWLYCISAAICIAIAHRQAQVFSARSVIVNSDDAGMCSAVNRGTIAALEAGFLQSVSIMTCCPGFDEFSKYALEHPEYDYGVHLTLTCDLRSAAWGPLLPTEEVRSLIDQEGCFHAFTGDVADLAEIDEVKAELRAQIRKALNAGIIVTHLDHHMFVLYARPDFLQAYVELGVEFDLPIRFSREPPKRFVDRFTGETSQAYLQAAADLESTRMPLLDRIESDNYSIAPEQKAEFVFNVLKNVPVGVTELVVHCSSFKGDELEPPDVAKRNADRVLLCSPELSAELKKHQLTLTTWKQLKLRRNSR